MSNINQRQVQKLSQSLSPQQIQMIKLLELHTMQFEQHVKQEIEENPVLEEDESQAEEKDENKDITVDDLKEDDDVPYYKGHISNISKDDKRRTVPISGGRSLSEYLMEQLSFKDLTQRQMTLAKFLVGSLDEDGYLRRDLNSIADDIAFSLGIETSEQELETILGYIHELEPTGIGARNLQECLLLQLGAMDTSSRSRKIAKRILTQYFEEFTKKHYDKLLTKLGISADEFRDAIDEIRHLSPKPGNLYSEGGSETVPYIIPDFILDYQNGEFDLSLNSYNIPEVKINKRDGDKSKLRPMILKDIADRTGLDVSTISRVVNSKYVQTHFGIIPLKKLFSEAMQTEDGTEVSSYEIKNLLSQCIDSEDKTHPLTDETLMDMLNEKGYRIARRTVAKYREMLGIPVARLRKQI